MRSETVSYRDLNLSTIEGATALYLRIKRAANHVCDEPGVGMEHFREWQSCYQAAIADAVGRETKEARRSDGPRNWLGD